MRRTAQSTIRCTLEVEGLKALLLRVQSSGILLCAVGFTVRNVSADITALRDLRVPAEM